MAKKSGKKIAIPSSILLVLLFVLSLFIACVLAPILELVAGKFIKLNHDGRTVLVWVTLGSFLVFCIIFRNSLKSDIRGSLNLPFYKVLKHFLVGVLVGAVLMGVSVAVVFLFKLRSIEFNPYEMIWRTALLALWITVFQEIIHRGFIFQSLRYEVTTFPAIIISSVFYSLLHFTYPRTVDSVSSASFDFLAGFKNVAHILDSFRDFSELLPDATGYFLLGVVLCLSYVITRSLYMAIGIHAFLVFINESRLITISPRHFTGRETIFGSSGTILESFMGSILCWILLLLVIIALLSVRVSSRDREAE